MKVSIIIPVSRPEETRACLKSLAQQDFDSSEFEVVLVSWQDLSVFENETLPYRVTLAQADVNHPSRMRNLAVLRSQAPTLGFLDDDTIIPPNWVRDVHEALEQHPERIIGGPNVDTRTAFAYAMANAIQEHPLLEGLKNHQQSSDAVTKTNAHNLPLSNIAMTRDTFTRVGGFNEVANYFMDGSEFLYIASRLDIPMYLHGGLTIQHNNRPVFLPYFKYKWRARRKIGANFILFPECYAHAKPIRLVLGSFALLQAVLLAFALFGGILSVAAVSVGVYVMVLWATGWRQLKRPLVFIPLAPCVFITQVLMYIGFLRGLFEGVMNVRNNLHVIEHKVSRYAVIRKEKG